MHLKRLRAPKNWEIKRKEYKFTARPLPGSHALNKCITLNLALKLLKYANTSREIKNILVNKEVLVDKRRVRDYRFPLGIMDVFEINELKDKFRILYDKNGKFIFHKINDEESKLKTCKIIGKKVLGKDKVQINLNDGRNILVKRDGYKTGDSLVIDLTNNSIKEHLKFEKNARIYIIDGKYIGEIGIVEDIIKGDGQERRIIFKAGDGKYETLMKYAIVVEKDFKI